MHTVGKLSKIFGLSRSTLLYYDKIGLLSPSERSKGNYRLYSEEDVERLRMILRHREAGIELNDIAKLLELNSNKVTEILSQRLRVIQSNIQHLKKQENVILAVLVEKVKLGDEVSFNKNTWSDLLIELGYSQEDLLEWHRNFELESKDEHRHFLLALGMDSSEINDLVNKMTFK